jgi:hypothetical protein
VGCFGVCFVQSIISKVSSTWFPDNQRSTSTAIISLTGTIGTLSSFILCLVFVTDHGEGEWTAENKLVAYS